MVMKQKILITGANGQLGKELQQLSAHFPLFDFVFLSREDLPVDDGEKAAIVFDKYRPAFCINCAAYTAVDKAESEQESAFRINAEAVGILAKLSRQHNARFVHVSTDYVFDGKATTPYKVDAVTNPQSVYGASKLEGERLALLENPDTVIIRTSWAYSEFGKNFVKTMLRLMSERKQIGVVNDQLGSPTYAADLAEAILQIVTTSEWHPGIYHYSNDGIVSWYELATAIKELSKLDCQVDPISTSAYPTPARRPAYSVLDTSKIKSQFNIKGKSWKESLERCLRRIVSA